MPHVTLPQGTIHYRESGAGAPIVLLHGYLMDGRLWDPVVERLDAEFRCITPDLPLGAHRTALNADADLTPTGLARIVHDFLAALDLDAVTLVGNDSGGAIAQIVAARHPELLGRLVLTPCDAFDNFPPKLFRPLIAAARAGGLTAMFTPLKSRRVRGLPAAFGWLTYAELPHDLIDSWLGAYFADKGVRRDTQRVTAGLGDDAFMTGIAEELVRFDKPALLAWATDDKFFPFEHAERLEAILPNARVERIEASRTWVMLDQPARTAELIRDFVRAEGRPAAQASPAYVTRR
jgi:pimeloyl-ACP methyl ester carboxylesterase